MKPLLLTNGTIHTMDPTRPRAGAIAFQDGRVIALDDAARALAGRQTEVIDLGGRTVIPGLIDSHIHFTGYAMGAARVKLEGARSLEEAVARVAERVRSSKPGEWVLGMGWNHLDWAEPRFPTKGPLDRVAPDNPVVLDRKDGHSAWLNSAALRALDITDKTPDPPGGVIERDAHGAPTGLLREKAMALVSGGIGFEGDQVSEGALLEAIRTAHRFGLTSIHNVEGANALRAFEQLHAKQRLTLRVLHMIPAENLEHAIGLGLETGWGDDWLRLGGVKIFADGSLGSQTAHMLEPFEGHPGNRGTIGDRAIRDVLDVYERLRREGVQVPLRIEHVQHLDPADLPRFSDLRVIASMQPIHATSDYRMADQFVGARARYAYAFKGLLDSGAKLIFGSDCPVETLDPLAGIHAAVTRTGANGEPPGGWHPEQCLTVEQAVRAYSQPLVPADDTHTGALGDCVVLSKDIFTIPLHEILSARVVYTIVGGQVVYAAGS
jgi:predicted amidohydrolase YtcJ